MRPTYRHSCDRKASAVRRRVSVRLICVTEVAEAAPRVRVHHNNVPDVGSRDCSRDARECARHGRRERGLAGIEFGLYERDAHNAQRRRDRDHRLRARWLERGLEVVRLDGLKL